MHHVLLAVSLVIFAGNVKAENNGTFPEGFLFGVSTSAYQAEGAWNEDGKGENIWDHWTHTDPSRIKNNDSADVSDDSYHHFVTDVESASMLGATHYRFSISWSRLLPTGMNSSVNAKAVSYYQELIDHIIYSRMIPVATLYYYDLPQPLQDLGGWTNPEMVRYWITFNDPKAICRLGYGTGVYAPGIALDGIGDYLCSYVVLKAHAAAYHLYQEEFPSLEAMVSISIDMEWSEPATDSASDGEAAERRNLFEFGIYGHPIFIGNWPQVVIDRVGNRSKHENFKRSRLPEFTKAEIDYIKGTADFMAINTYSTRLVSDVEEPEYDDPGYMKDMKAEPRMSEDWSLGSDGNAIVPWGVRKALIWLKNVYNGPKIFITENGVGDDARVQDYTRITFITEYLLAILDAIYEDKVRVFGYTARSLLDSFEWTEGYSHSFGFYRVVDPGNMYYLRMPKASVTFYRQLTDHRHVSNNTLQPTTLPTTTTTEGAASRMVLYPSLILIITYLSLLLV